MTGLSLAMPPTVDCSREMSGMAASEPRLLSITAWRRESSLPRNAPSNLAERLACGLEDRARTAIRINKQRLTPPS